MNVKRTYVRADNLPDDEQIVPFDTIAFELGQILGLRDIVSVTIRKASGDTITYEKLPLSNPSR